MQMKKVGILSEQSFARLVCTTSVEVEGEEHAPYEKNHRPVGTSAERASLSESQLSFRIRLSVSNSSASGF
jgi:hypothetical protein